MKNEQMIENGSIPAELYQVVERNPNSWREDGTLELVGRYDDPTDDIIEAAVELSARMYDAGEGGNTRLAIEHPDGSPLADGELDEALRGVDITERVYDYLTERLGWPAYRATKALS